MDSKRVVAIKAPTKSPYDARTTQDEANRANFELKRQLQGGRAVDYSLSSHPHADAEHKNNLLRRSTPMPLDPGRALATFVSRLEANASDAQVVLTCLVEIYDTVASNKLAAPSIVTAHLAPSKVVLFLRGLIQTFALDEEIAWHWCRLLALTCRTSSRFQLEAGHLQLWTQLHSLRSMHPESVRVVEASLDCNEALFHGVELHNLTTRPAQSLIAEMLQLMDRFHTPPLRIARLSPHYNFSRLVVGALAVLCALYASPRIVPIVEEHNSTYAGEILDRMLVTLGHFLSDRDASRVWLAMCRQQLQQKPTLALVRLFQPNPRHNDSNGVTAWATLLLTRWAADHDAVFDLCALFTQIFAIPEHAVGLQPCLPSVVIVDQDLLRRLCELLEKYTQQERPSDAHRREKLRSAVMEITRTVRQWSCVPLMLALFPKVPAVKARLVPTLVSMLHETLSALHPENCQSAETSATLRLTLEVLLTVQQLNQISVYTEMLKRSETLQDSLSSLSKRLAKLRTAMSNHGGHFVRDDDLIALVERELKKTSSACPRAAPAPVSSQRRRISTSKPSTSLSSSNTILLPRVASTRAITLKKQQSSSTLVTLQRVDSRSGL